ncbi:MAG TPA: NlpC/P60 family protein [Pseudonocardia sp.]
MTLTGQQRATLGAVAAGASVATATMTGTFPAIQPDLPDLFGASETTTTFHQVSPAASQRTVTAAAPQAAAAALPGPRAASASSPLSVVPAVTDGPTMATDMHQSDARQIAALSKSVSMHDAETARVAKAAQDAVAAKAAQSALKVPASIGGVSVSGLAGSAKAATALSYASKKLGLPYVWGAAGPTAFDCSGLTQWAFKQVGISLPRTSQAQSHVGTAVSKGDLRPGDLVFFYSPVSHVGIYLGNNKLLHASESGEPVKVSDMSNFPFHNARRV